MGQETDWPGTVWDTLVLWKWEAAKMAQSTGQDLDSADILVLHSLLSSAWVDPNDLTRARGLFDKLADIRPGPA
jgi:hypothetical protein